MSVLPGRNEATANQPEPALAGNTCARPLRLVPSAVADSLLIPMVLPCGLPESWNWIVMAEFDEMVEPHTRPSC